MVKLEYRPYLYALIGLTVCVSLYEIVYVQWDSGSPATDAQLLIDGGPQRSAAESRIAKHQNHDSSARRSGRRRGGRDGDGDGSITIHPPPEPPAMDGKTGNRGILSSGRIAAQDLGGGQDETHALTLSSVDLPKNDFRNLIDIQNDFDFLINQKPCPVRPPIDSHRNTSARSNQSPQPPLLVLVLVHSAPKNFRKRLTIRQTWANHPDTAMKVYFMLGSVASRTLQFKLEMENERFGDLIQGNFTDAYRNMTYKHVAALKWFSYFCADTPILLKTDDDVFVNSPALMEYIRENVDGVRTRRKFVKCRVLEKGAVKRSYRSKWRVSTKEYAPAEYPPYCPGFIVLYSADMVQELYREAQSTKYFWIDDVHVTGTLVQQVNATLTSFRDVFFKKDNKKRLREPYVRNMPLFTDPDLREAEIRKMWQMVAVKGGGGGHGSRIKEMMREDAEAVAYLAMDSDSSGARGGLHVAKGVFLWAMMVFSVLLGSRGATYLIDLNIEI